MNSLETFVGLMRIRICVGPTLFVAKQRMANENARSLDCLGRTNDRCRTDFNDRTLQICIKCHSDWFDPTQSPKAASTRHN